MLHVHHRVRRSDVDDRPPREDALHGLPENLPLRGPPEVVHDHEAAPQEILPQTIRLGVAQVPVAHLRRVDPGVVIETVIGQGCVPGFSDVDPGQPVHAGLEVPLRGGHVHHPPAPAGTAAAETAAAEPAAAEPSSGSEKVRILDPNEVELGIGSERGRHVFALPRPVLSQDGASQKEQKHRRRRKSRTDLPHMEHYRMRAAPAGSPTGSCPPAKWRTASTPRARACP
jgi:hypothetical protein